MLILTKKRFHFKNADGDNFITAGQMTMEEAPDWIQRMELYHLAKGDGDIIEVKANTAKHEVKAVEALAKAESEPVEDEEAVEEKKPSRSRRNSAKAE